MGVQVGGEEARYRAMWREVLKHRAIEALGGRCFVCKCIYPDMVYHFHHLNPQEKEQTIFGGNVNSAKTWLRIRDELKKTVLVCPTCHMLIHGGYINNPTKSTFLEEYYEWDWANRSRTPRDQMVVLAEQNTDPEVIEKSEIKLNRVNIKHFDKTQILN